MRTDDREGIMRNGFYLLTLRAIQLAVIMGFLCASGTAVFGESAKPPAAVLKAETRSTPAAEEVTPQEEYTYIPGERRDPFESLLFRGEEAGAAGDELTPLQKVNVEDLKLVGIVKNPDGNTALIQTPDGKGYFLRGGLPLGKNEGVVAKILEDKMIVKEKKKDFLGQITVSEVVLELKKEEGRR
jgi:type IV pilus assembly protein PilP